MHSHGRIWPNRNAFIIMVHFRFVLVVLGG